ncbi:MAG: hypothetical protein KGI54_15155 [Pseudomonadota bacterium]|nr:hypothetical protein [Pseudomonadota bacterium]
MQPIYTDEKTFDIIPERMLWLNVIELAIKDADYRQNFAVFKKNNEKKRAIKAKDDDERKIKLERRKKYFADQKSLLKTDALSAWQFLAGSGLDGVCSALSLDADHLRINLKKEHSWAKILFSENGLNSLIALNFR